MARKTFPAQSATAVGACRDAASRQGVAIGVPQIEDERTFALDEEVGRITAERRAGSAPAATISASSRAVIPATVERQEAWAIPQTCDPSVR